MINLILFIIISISITNILQNEYIFQWFRDFLNKKCKVSFIKDLYFCPSCLSMYIGMAISFIFPPFFPLIIVNIIACGLISSIANKIFAIKINTF